MNLILRIAGLPLVLIMTMVMVYPVSAQTTIENPDVTLHVEGLACPICAYGLEKKLKKIDEIEAVSIHIKTGEVRLKLRSDAEINEDRIREAVLEAGFTLNEIDYRNAASDSRTRIQ